MRRGEGGEKVGGGGRRGFCVMGKEYGGEEGGRVGGEDGGMV